MLRQLHCRRGSCRAVCCRLVVHERLRAEGAGCLARRDTYEPAFMNDAFAGRRQGLPCSGKSVRMDDVYHIAQEASRTESFNEVLQVIIGGGLLGGLLRDDAVAEILPQSWLIALAQRDVAGTPRTPVPGPLSRRKREYTLGAVCSLVCTLRKPSTRSTGSCANTRIPAAARC